MSSQSQSPAERLAERHRTARPMPSLTLAREGEPAVPVSRPAKRSAERRKSINTPLSDHAIDLLDRMTHHLRKQHGRKWRLNSTVEAALEALARELKLENPA
jgi:hypothetical protein